MLFCSFALLLTFFLLSLSSSSNALDKLDRGVYQDVEAPVSEREKSREGRKKKENLSMPLRQRFEVFVSVGVGVTLFF